MAVSSIEFARGENEFLKAGFTPIPSDLVKPARVKESPVQMECKVQDIMTLGDHGGAGHLIICRVVRMHIAEAIIDDNNRINPHKIDLMGRMGRSYYTRAHGDAIETIVQPVTRIGIGFDQLPLEIQQSKVLTGNELGLLAGIPQEPDPIDVNSLIQHDQELAHWSSTLQGLHFYIKGLIQKNKIEYAAQIAFAFSR